MKLDPKGCIGGVLNTTPKTCDKEGVKRSLLPYTRNAPNPKLIHALPTDSQSYVELDLEDYLLRT